MWANPKDFFHNVFQINIQFFHEYLYSAILYKACLVCVWNVLHLIYNLGNRLLFPRLNCGVHAKATGKSCWRCLFQMVLEMWMLVAKVVVEVNGCRKVTLLSLSKCKSSALLCLDCFISICMSNCKWSTESVKSLLVFSSSLITQKSA